MGNKRILIWYSIIVGIIIYTALAVMAYSFYETGLSVVVILLTVLGINIIAFLLGTTIPVIGVFIYTFLAKEFIVMMVGLGNIQTSKITDLIYQIGLVTVVIYTIGTIVLISSHSRKQ
ncbi:MAG: hypothetical protein KAS12_03380 [Candidatus Aenigmarchaeota archaeon]|nr:hypothetical protein [Candidatus Aenigmarchaeota archaeon]